MAQQHGAGRGNGNKSGKQANIQSGAAADMAAWRWVGHGLGGLVRVRAAGG